MEWAGKEHRAVGSGQDMGGLGRCNNERNASESEQTTLGGLNRVNVVRSVLHLGQGKTCVY